MKYLLLLLFIVACVNNKPKETSLYKCSILTLHGIYTKTEGNYTSLEEAINDTEKIRVKLAEYLPKDSFSSCIMVKNEK